MREKSERYKQLNAKQAGYETVNVDGLSDYLSSILVSDLTGRPVFTPQEIRVVVVSALRVVSQIMLAGRWVNIEGFGRLRIKYSEFEEKQFRRALIYPEEPFYSLMVEGKEPDGAEEIYEACLTEKQKRVRAKFQEKKNEREKEGNTGTGSSE